MLICDKFLAISVSKSSCSEGFTFFWLSIIAPRVSEPDQLFRCVMCTNQMTDHFVKLSVSLSMKIYFFNKTFSQWGYVLFIFVMCYFLILLFVVPFNFSGKPWNKIIFTLLENILIKINWDQVWKDWVKTSSGLIGFWKCVVFWWCERKRLFVPLFCLCVMVHGF